jgi:hypothetical protein
MCVDVFDSLGHRVDSLDSEGVIEELCEIVLWSGVTDHGAVEPRRYLGKSIERLLIATEGDVPIVQRLSDPRPQRREK